MANSKNIYKISFNINCPVDNEQISYKLKIVSNHRIMVEKINEIIDTFGGQGLHEDIADKMQSLGGKQQLIAMHQNVQIKTIR